jgi:predicted transposase YbfD/YdcC
MRRKTVEKLFKKIAYEGGTIVSSAECCEIEIAQARCCGTMFVDEDGLGYIWRPANKNKENLAVAIGALRDIENWVHGIEGHDTAEEAAHGMNARAIKALSELA